MTSNYVNINGKNGQNELDKGKGVNNQTYGFGGTRNPVKEA